MVYQYKGSAYGADMLITVEGDLRESNTAKVTYDIEDLDTRAYTVEIDNMLGRNAGVKLFDSFGLIFEGFYRPTILINKDGSPYMEETRVTYIVSNMKTYDENYIISYSHIVSTALRDNVYKRGDGGLLLFAALVIVILIIDIKWPLFFFNMRYAHAVRNAEPSDRFLAMQMISRFVYPIVIIIFLVLSLS